MGVDQVIAVRGGTGTEPGTGGRVTRRQAAAGPAARPPDHRHAIRQHPVILG